MRFMPDRLAGLLQRVGPSRTGGQPVQGEEGGEGEVVASSSTSAVPAWQHAQPSTTDTTLTWQGKQSNVVTTTSSPTANSNTASPMAWSVAYSDRRPMVDSSPASDSLAYTVSMRSVSPPTSPRTVRSTPSQTPTTTNTAMTGFSRVFSAKTMHPRRLFYRRSPDPRSSPITGASASLYSGGDIIIDDSGGGAGSSSGSNGGGHFLSGLGIGDVYMHDNDSGRGIDVMPQVDFVRRLPPEIALHVLSFTNHPTLCASGQVSRYWRQLANDNDVWRALYHRNPSWGVQLPPKLAPIPLPTHAGPSEWHLPAPPLSADAPLHYKRLFRTRYCLDAQWMNGEQRTHKWTGHQDSIYCVHADEECILTGSRDRSLRQWDTRTGQCTRMVVAHSASVLCMRRHGQRLITGSSDFTACVWRLPTFECEHRLVGHRAGVLDVCMDDHRIVTCSKDNTVRVWDTVSGECLRVLTGHRGPVNAIQMSGGLIVSASGDATLRVWDVQSLRCIRIITGHTRGLACVRFDGHTIVSGSNDRTIREWNVHTGECLRVLEGHKDLVRTLWFDDRWIVSGSYDHTVKVWQRSTGIQILELQGHNGWIFDVHFDHSKIISVGQDRQLFVWDFGYGLDLTYVR